MRAASRAVRCAPVRTHLMMLVLATAVPLFGFSAYLLYSSDVQRRESADIAAVNVAHGIASATVEFLRNSDALLMRLAGATTLTKDGLICGRELNDLDDVLPGFSNAAIFTADGRLSCSAKPFLDREPPEASGQPWFKEAIVSRHSYLSAPIIGSTNGRWISVYASTIRNAAGEVIGLVAIGIDLANFPPVMRTPATAAAPIVGLVSDTGTIVSRSVEPDSSIGKQLGIPVNEMFAASASHVVRTQGADSVDRRYGFVRIADQPWIAYAASPSEALDRQRLKELVALCVLALAVAIVAGAAALVIARGISKPMRSMANVARAVALGGDEHQAPVEGPREVREVVTEFNRMISVRARAEAHLVALAGRCRTLSKRMLDVEETERRLINRELHDQVGQNLAILNLTLDGLENKMRGRWADDTASRLSEARALLNTTIEQVRDVMADLRPAALDDYGLLAALRSFCVSYAARTGLKVEVSGDDIVPRLPSAIETALFRIAQAALVNVAKHARAARIDVDLHSTRDLITLVITDDGVGFNSEHALQQPTWGLTTMRERADAIGANLHIESAAGEGVRVIVEMQRAA